MYGQLNVKFVKMTQNRGFSGGGWESWKTSSPIKVACQFPHRSDSLCNVTEGKTKDSPYNKTVFCLFQFVSRLMI